MSDFFLIFFIIWFRRDHCIKPFKEDENFLISKILVLVLQTLRCLTTKFSRLSYKVVRIQPVKCFYILVVSPELIQLRKALGWLSGIKKTCRNKPCQCSKYVFNLKSHNKATFNACQVVGPITGGSYNRNCRVVRF